jgi:hypothetical protein
MRCLVCNLYAVQRTACCFGDLENDRVTPKDLKSLIESDAEAKEHFTAGRDVQCAERCIAIAPPIRGPVPCDYVRREASLSGAWAAITLASRETSPAPAQIKGICLTFLDWVMNSPTLDFDLAQVKVMAGGLVAAGLISQEQLDELSAMMNRPQTVTTDEVSQCRQQ